jgi:hypothetical protein
VDLAVEKELDDGPPPPPLARSMQNAAATTPLTVSLNPNPFTSMGCIHPDGIQTELKPTAELTNKEPRKLKKIRLGFVCAVSVS